MSGKGLSDGTGGGGVLVGVVDDDIAHGARGGVELGEDVVVAGNRARVDERDRTSIDTPEWAVRMDTNCNRARLRNGLGPE